MPSANYRGPAVIGYDAARGNGPIWGKSSAIASLMLGKRVRDGAPGRIRTCDTRFRKPLLYPLSYEGIIAIGPFIPVFVPGD